MTAWPPGRLPRLRLPPTPPARSITTMVRPRRSARRYPSAAGCIGSFPTTEQSVRTLMKHSHTSPRTRLDPTNPGAGPRLCEPQEPRVPARTTCLGRGRCGSQSRGPAALLLVAAAILAPLAATAQQDITNRLSLSARFGFNISARFKGLSTLPLPANHRTTGHGDSYNYDDGY